MLFIGIDVAKSKHDCCIIDSDGVVITDSLRISNTKEGFDTLYNAIVSALDSNDFSKVKIGLESTGHYSTNITNYLYSTYIPWICQAKSFSRFLSFSDAEQ